MLNKNFLKEIIKHKDDKEYIQVRLLSKNLAELAKDLIYRNHYQCKNFKKINPEKQKYIKKIVIKKNSDIKWLNYAYKYAPQKINITHLYFNRSFPDKIKFEKIEFPTLKCIRFGNKINYCFEDDVFPPEIEKIELGDGYYSERICGLPKSLKILKIGRYYDQPILEESLPNSIKYISFGRKFNQPLTKKNLPNNLIKLKLGCNYNQKLDNLPECLKMLKLEGYFNQSLKKLPEGLLKLEFSDDFNKPINNLPKTIKILKFGCEFDQPIDYLINLKSLEKLLFGQEFNQSIEVLSKLPALKNVKFGSNFSQPIDKIFKKLKSIKICKFDVTKNIKLINKQ